MSLAILAAELWLRCDFSWHRSYPGVCSGSVAYSPGVKGRYLGDRGSFGDIAAPLLDAYAIALNELPNAGESFLCKSKS